MDCKSKYEIHMQICKQLNETYFNKNHDYGDAYAFVRSKVPHAIRVRLWDKMLRFDNLLSGQDACVKDESIEDTLMDMANYCIMELVERKIDKGYLKE